MNRRDFIRIGGAAGATGLLVPSWLLPRSTRAKSIDLSLFSDDCTTRFNTARPFLQGDHIYATDCRVAVRVGREIVADLAGDKAKLPPADRLRWPDSDSDGWMPLSKFQRVSWDYADCPRCYGRGRYGAGVHECNCEYLPICDRHGSGCNGWTGGIVCDQCDGKGNVDWCWEFDGHWFNPSYIAKFDTLPGVEVSNGRTCYTNDRGKVQGLEVLQARFDGGVGLLCPLDELEVRE